MATTVSTIKVAVEPAYGMKLSSAAIVPQRKGLGIPHSIIAHAVARPSPILMSAVVT